MKWKTIFLQIALRALRKVHYDFGILALGQGELTRKHFRGLNQGNGVNYAPEETVRDMMLHEVIHTGLCNEHLIDGKRSSYWIDREVRVSLNRAEAIKVDTSKKFFDAVEYKKPEQYKAAKKSFDIDIVFKRIQNENEDKNPTYPGLIEAKRFELVTYNPRTSEYKIRKPQIQAIKRDILKLKLFRDYYLTGNHKLELKGEKYEDFYTHLLLWGTGPADFNFQQKVIESIAVDGVQFSHIEKEYFPLQWEEVEGTLKITHLLWVALVEIQ